MVRLEKLQNFRVGLHSLGREPVKIDRYDSTLPRPSPQMFHWHSYYHHEDKMRSPITGIPYRPVTPSWLSERIPPGVVWRNGRWEMRCRFWTKETGCDQSFTNGIAEQMHIQAVHLSRNDRPALVRGEVFHPQTWYRDGRITDLRGFEERITPRRIA